MRISRLKTSECRWETADCQLKVAFDCRMAFHTGIGRYIRNLLKEISIFPVNFFLLSAIDSQEVVANAKKILVKTPIYSIAEQFAIPYVLRRNKSDILHVPHYNAPIFFKGKLIVTIHDLIHLRFKNRYKKHKRTFSKILMGKVLKRADAVISVSETTKSDIVNFFKVPEEKIYVIKEAVDESINRVIDKQLLESFKTRFKLPEEYVLTVTSVRPHKNLPGFIEGMKILQEKMSVPVVVVLSNKYSKHVCSWTRPMKEGKQIFYLTGLNNRDLCCAYSMASCFVIPSLWEGFGFPALEAGKCKIPVCSSNIGSLPEILQDAASYFDPTQPDQIADSVYNILTDKQTRFDKLNKMNKLLDTYSWHKTASETFDLYKQIKE